jgi:hypothetical protein
VTPPLEKHGVANKFKPGCELQVRLLEELPQFVRSYILAISNLILVGIDINIRSNEKDIID